MSLVLSRQVAWLFGKGVQLISGSLYGVGNVFLSLSDVVVRWIEAYLSKRASRVYAGGEHSGAIPMHSGAPQGSLIGIPLFFLFVNGLPDVLEALTLLSADDVKMASWWTQNMNLHSSLTAAWYWSKK